MPQVGLQPHASTPASDETPNPPSESASQRQFPSTPASDETPTPIESASPRRFPYDVSVKLEHTVCDRHTIYLHRLCGARSGSPQLWHMAPGSNHTF